MAFAAVICPLKSPSLLRVEERPDPEAGADGVVVDVEATGSARRRPLRRGPVPDKARNCPSCPGPGRGEAASSAGGPRRCPDSRWGWQVLVSAEGSEVPPASWPRPRNCRWPCIPGDPRRARAGRVLPRATARACSPCATGQARGPASACSFSARPGRRRFGGASSRWRGPSLPGARGRLQQASVAAARWQQGQAVLDYVGTP